MRASLLRLRSAEGLVRPPDGRDAVRTLRRSRTWWTNRHRYARCSARRSSATGLPRAYSIRLHCLSVFDPTGRNQLVATTRHEIYKLCGLTLFPHQASWQLATEGWHLTDQHAKRGLPFVNVLETSPAAPDDPSRAAVVPRLVQPRPGGVAHVAWDLAAFKSGKSFSTSAWMTGFTFVPNARVEIIGLEYSTAE